MLTRISWKPIDFAYGLIAYLLSIVRTTHQICEQKRAKNAHHPLH
jgi:hypothetical protein